MYDDVVDDTADVDDKVVVVLVRESVVAVAGSIVVSS